MLAELVLATLSFGGTEEVCIPPRGWPPKPWNVLKNYYKAERDAIPCDPPPADERLDKIGWERANEITDDYVTLNEDFDEIYVQARELAEGKR